MGESFPHVFEPIRLRHKTLSARITFGAHTANMGEEGLPSARHCGYYAERARGGAGMIVVEPVPVHRTGVLTRANFRPGDDAIVEPFRRLVAECREANPAVVMVQQLYHVGQHGDGDNSFAPNWSPSGLPSYHDADGSHAMSADEIEQLITCFVEAAARAQRCGFDGVEVFAAYHAIVDQFWTPWSNRRTDEWGGSFENRMRFSEQILRRTRERCGEDFIVGLAVSMDTGSEPALAMAELAEVVAWHDQRRLMDYVSCGTGSYFDFSLIIPPSLADQRLGVPFAAELKKVVTHALVQAESHVRTPEAAEEVLASGLADLVSVVRGQIADPHLVAKARAGRPQDVRPCISCNQLCWGRRSRDYWISCLVNPSAGREFLWNGDRPVPLSAPTSAGSPRRTPRSVVVVGGGPAGLEAARVAAARGHRVTLLEAADELGGQFRLAGRQPSRGQILDLLVWYARQLPQLGVDVRLGVQADVDAVLATGGVAVLATGAVAPRTGFQRALPMVDVLPGAGLPGVLSVQDVLTDPGTAGVEGRIVLLDDVGDWRGLGTAVLLAEAGHAVTLVTSAAVAGAGLAHSAVDGMLRARFARAGGAVVTGTVLTAWTGAAALTRSLGLGVEGELAADRLVIAETARPRTELAGALAASGAPLEVHTLGDCVAARRASVAFFEGRKLGMAL